MSEKKKLCIVPGSFDPMTLGHRALVETALTRYEKVVVAVMVNPAKRTMFSMEARVEIAKRTVFDLGNVSVISAKGLLIDLFDKLGADAVVKGWRNEKDLDYENKMADWNKEHNPKFVTELIHSRSDYQNMSSTLVRNRLEMGDTADDLMTGEAWRYVEKLLEEKKKQEAKKK